MAIAIVAALALGTAAVERHKLAGIARDAKTATAAKIAAPPATLPANAPIPPTVIGMNVSGLNYWIREDPLYDPIRNHGAFTIKRPGIDPKFVDLPDDVARTPNGGITHVRKDTELLLQAGESSQLDAKLDCHASPGWWVGTLNAKTVENGGGFTVTRQAGLKDDERWMFIMKATKDDATLAEFACRPPGAPAGSLFRPSFFTNLKPFGILRFLNWMHANDQPETSWAKRPQPDDLAYPVKGMPVEVMVQLANELHADPWFTLPFDADDDYQRKFATYVRDHMAPGLKVYAELSNEVWNSTFPQSKKATALGKARYPSEDDVHANDYFYGDRIRHMMAIWSEVFAGEKQRLVRVAGTQAGWPDRAEYLLGHADTAKSVDVLAIAPYFGNIPFDVPGTGAARVDGIFQRMPDKIDEQIANAKKSKAIALKYGVRLVAYEAGTTYGAYVPDMTADVEAVLHDPRMTAQYERYINRWAKEIGGEMVLFDSNDGGWRHWDYDAQPWRDSRKMTAAINVIATLPQGRERNVKPVTP